MGATSALSERVGTELEDVAGSSTAVASVSWSSIALVWAWDGSNVTAFTFCGTPPRSVRLSA